MATNETAVRHLWGMMGRVVAETLLFYIVLEIKYRLYSLDYETSWYSIFEMTHNSYNPRHVINAVTFSIEEQGQYTFTEFFWRITHIFELFWKVRQKI